MVLAVKRHAAEIVSAIDVRVEVNTTRGWAALYPLEKTDLNDLPIPPKSRSDAPAITAHGKFTNS